MSEQNSTEETSVSKDNQHYAATYGVTYDVFHGSPPHKTKLRKRPIPAEWIKIDIEKKRVLLTMDAYSGEKGNTVTVSLPIEGIQMMLNEFNQGVLSKELLLRYWSPSR